MLFKITSCPFLNVFAISLVLLMTGFRSGSLFSSTGVGTQIRIISHAFNCFKSVVAFIFLFLVSFRNTDDSTSFIAEMPLFTCATLFLLISNPMTSAPLSAISTAKGSPT
ncbi:hypothetical protein ES703_110842 [subsurface metagenome]